MLQGTSDASGTGNAVDVGFTALTASEDLTINGTAVVIARSMVLAPEFNSNSTAAISGNISFTGNSVDGYGTKLVSSQLTRLRGHDVYRQFDW